MRLGLIDALEAERQKCLSEQLTRRFWEWCLGMSLSMGKKIEAREVAKLR